MKMIPGSTVECIQIAATVFGRDEAADDVITDDGGFVFKQADVEEVLRCTMELLRPSPGGWGEIWVLEESES